MRLSKGDEFAVNPKQGTDYALELLNRAREVAWEKGRTRITKKELERRRQLNAQKRQKTDESQNWAERARQEEARTGIPVYLQVGFGVSGSGPRPSDNDPQPIAGLLKNLISARRWDRALVGARVISEWETVVGEKVAAHSKAEKYQDGVLSVSTDSTVWAQQLRLLLPQIMNKLDERFGRGIIDKVIVNGPKQRSWKHGPLSVPGRGPRDTYG